MPGTHRFAGRSPLRIFDEPKTWLIDLLGIQYIFNPIEPARPLSLRICTLGGSFFRPVSISTAARDARFQQIKTAIGPLVDRHNTMSKNGSIGGF